MKKILKWIREHVPRWLDLSHQRPWEHPTIKESQNKSRQEDKKDI